MKNSILKKTVSLALTLALLLSLLPAVTLTASAVDITYGSADGSIPFASSGQTGTSISDGVFTFTGEDSAGSHNITVDKYGIYMMPQDLNGYVSSAASGTIDISPAGTGKGFMMKSITINTYKSDTPATFVIKFDSNMVSTITIDPSNASTYDSLNGDYCYKTISFSAPSPTSAVHVEMSCSYGVGFCTVAGFTASSPTASPTVTGISPSSGPATGGTSVTITGTNLTGATGVSFGGTAAASFTVDSATQITATTPAHAAGTVNVTVTTAGGTGTGTGLFTYDSNAAPTAGFGQAMSFGSTYATVTAAADNSQNITGAFTAEMWIKRTGTDNTSYVFARNGGSGQWAVLSYSDGFKFYTSAAGVGVIEDSKITVSDTNWHHIAYTYNGSVLTFYLDGAAVGSKTVAVALPNATDFCIGNSLGGANPAHDTIDELRLWNTCRTQDQIKSDMYQSISKADADYSSLVFYCKFEEGSGQGITESVKNSVGNVRSSPTNTASGTWVESVANPSWTTAENTPFSGYLIGSDADGDALTYSIVANGAHGTASITSGNQFMYTPHTNVNGSDSFTYKVADPYGAESSPQTVNITVTPGNKAPFTRDITSFLQLGAKAGAKSADGSYATNKTDDITLETWIYLENTTGAHHAFFNGNGQYNGYGFYVSGQTVNILLGSVGWIVCSSGASYNEANSAVLTAGQWTHIAATRNNSDGGTYGWKIYVNGQPMATQFSPNPGITLGIPNDLNASSYVQIGSSAGDPAGLSVSEARIWEKALTQAEIQANMSGAVATNASGLVGYWKLTDGSGTTIADIQTNKAHLNLPITGPIAWVSSTAGSTAEDTPLSGRLAGGDLETPVTYSKASDPAHGTVSVDANGAYTYTPAADFNGSDSFTFVTNDGSLNSASRTVNITVSPANDAPVITAPTSITMAEDTAKILTGISFSDADAGSGAVTATFSVPSGTLSASSGGGVTVGGPASALTLTGTIANINAYIAAWNLSYTPAANANGSLTLNVSVNDGGYTGGGGAQTASTTIQLNITSVNDAPTLSGGPYAWAGTNEDTTSSPVTVSSIVSALNGQDADGNPLGIAITAASGRGTWQYSTDGTSWNNVGAVPGINALLLSSTTLLRYIPDGQNGETATISFRAWDGTSGSPSTNGIRSFADASTNGGSSAFSTGTAQAILTVTAVNDAPVNTVPSEQLVLQDGTLIFSGANGNQISVSDLDAGVGAVRVTLIPTNGLLSLSNTLGLSFLVGSGTGDAAMSFEGTLSDINEALNDLSFQPTPGYYGPASMQIMTNDLGLSGSGGAQTDTDTVSVTVRLPVPAVSSVTSPSANGTYKAGDTILIRVAFSQNVTVTGTPALALSSGGTATYDASGSDTTALTFSYVVGSGQSASDLDYASTNALTFSGGTILSADGTAADLTLPAPGTAGSLGANKDLVIDGITPTITSVTVPANGVYTVGQNLDVTVHYSENVTVDSSGGAPRIPATLDTGGTVYMAYVSGSGTGALLFRLTVSSGQLDEDGISIGAAINLNGGTIRDAAGNDAETALGGAGSTASVLVDAVIPTLTGTVRTDDTHITVTLSEPCQNLVKTNDGGFTVRKTGTLTAYTVFATAQGTDNSHVVLTVADMDSAGTAGVTVTYASGTNGTIADLAGNALASDSGGKTISAWKSAPTGGSGTSTNNSAEVIVNGHAQTAGASKTTTGSDGRTTTTVTVNTGRLESILNSQETGATVTVPIKGGADAASGVLTGGMVQTMEDKDATLVIQTDSGSYAIPASEINIGAISQQLGTNVTLDDITVTVSISDPSEAMAKVVENAAQGGGFTLLIPAVDYTITCTYGGQTITVNTFSAYVERTVAIPDGVDPSRITTGVVVDPDGTVHHVPTRVTVIGGKYYAVISSLTNSTYSVVWNPVEFADVANHWAKDAVNDMGSRMIVTGTGSGNYAPYRSMTRAEFAAIMVRALGLEPGTGESGFGDVSSAEWYCGYIKTAALYGIIKGYSDGTFGPNSTISREQAMTMITRAMALTGLDSGLTDSKSDTLLSAYTDGSAVSAYARDSIAACLKIGIATGTSAVTLSPKADITRAEVAVMVERLLQKSGLI